MDDFRIVCMCDLEINIKYFCSLIDCNSILLANWDNQAIKGLRIENLLAKYFVGAKVNGFGEILGRTDNRLITDYSI